MSGHTPGPGWQVIDEAARVLESLENGDTYKSGELSALASGLRAIELNRLQAAAPAMYEALMIALGGLNEGYAVADGESFDNTMAFIDNARKKVRAALALAEKGDE